MTDTPDSHLRKLCMTLYATYAASAILQFFEQTLILGLLALIIAYILSSTKKKAAKNTIYATHLRWMNRTFWIGTGIIVPVAMIIASFLIWQFTNVETLAGLFTGEDTDTLMNNLQGYIQENMTKISVITFITMIPTVLWWLRRCWIGYSLAEAGKPVENVTTWL